MLSRAKQFGELRHSRKRKIFDSLELQALNLAESEIWFLLCTVPLLARAWMKSDRGFGIEWHIDLADRLVSESRFRLTPPSAIASCASVSSMPISFSAWCIISLVMRGAGVGDGLGDGSRCGRRCLGQSGRVLFFLV
jgi:hypothetical protein